MFGKKWHMSDCGQKLPWTAIEIIFGLLMSGALIASSVLGILTVNKINLENYEDSSEYRTPVELLKINEF